MTNKLDLDMEKIHQLRNNGKTFEEISELYDCHRSTINRRYNKWIEKQRDKRKSKNSFLDKIKSFLT